jgi:hypothetical protein
VEITRIPVLGIMLLKLPPGEFRQFLVATVLVRGADPAWVFGRLDNEGSRGLIDGATPLTGKNHSQPESHSGSHGWSFTDEHPYVIADDLSSQFLDRSGMWEGLIDFVGDARNDEGRGKIRQRLLNPVNQLKLRAVPMQVGGVYS